VLEAVGDAIGMDRVGIRFSPNIYSQGVEDSDPIALFTALASRLEELKVPWIELREAHQPTSAGAIPTAPVSPAMRPLYSGKILLNSDYDGPSARARMAEGIADGISFGRPFISNPDLVHRIAIGAPLAPGDEATFYSGDARGYVDYPRLDEAAAA
jgi:2,4-dienoyl-CoA reductase-like NADH-dependent reductase (Old Yellow Enzyme family)